MFGAQITPEERKRKFQAMERRELRRAADGSMELVEKAPSEVKADVKKDEAEGIKEKLEAVGGSVELE